MDITTRRKVQVDIEALTPQGLFRDALYFEEDAVPADNVIEAMAQERADAWLAIINTPPVEEPPAEPENEVTCEDGEVLYV